MFRQENPDLVTLDIMMPDIDGIQVLRQLKQEKPQIPVIMLTAYDYRDDFSVWVSDAYVVKSSDLLTLKSTIRQIVEKK
jgi:CheY-like chemotaxis protein